MMYRKTIFLIAVMMALLVTSNASSTNDIKCDVCTFITHRIGDYLEQNKTESEILDVLENECKYLGTKQAICKTIISAYGKELIDFIVNEGVDKACGYIGLCPSSNEDIECQLCQIAEVFIVKELSEKTTIEDILKELDMVCTLLSRHTSIDMQLCENFMDVFATEILKFIEEGVSNVCDILGLCDENFDKCGMCTLLVGEAEKLVESGWTKEEIEKGIDSLCEYLPSKDVAECDDIADTLVNDVIDLIFKYETPQVICEKVHLCNETISV